MNKFIIDRANRLIKKYGSRDPFVIAKAMNIQIMFMDLGSLKGFYKRDGHNRFIVINECLDAPTKKLISAHELGHDQLHGHLAKSQALQEFSLYDMKNKTEYQANVFASWLLLEESRIIGHLKQGYDFFEVAKMLEVDPKLLAIRLMTMKDINYNDPLPFL